MSSKRLFDAVERRGDIGRRITAFVLPISNRPRVTSSCAGKVRLREPCEHTSGPNLASRDNVAHGQTLYTILETPPPALQRQQFDCAVVLARRVHWSIWRRATKSPRPMALRRGRRASKLGSKFYECGPSSRRGGTPGCGAHTPTSVLLAGLRF